MEKGENVIRFDWAAKNILRDKATFVILEGFLSALLNEQVTIIDLLESESNRKQRESKSNRVDIKAKNSLGEIFLIEIQQADELDYFERILFSAARTVTEHVMAGIDYRQVKKVYSVNILYFNLGEGSDWLYHGQNTLRGVNTGDTLTVSKRDADGMRMVGPENIFPEYYILRVKKFDDEEPKTPIGEWMRYFRWAYIDPDTTVPGLREAMEQLKLMLMDEKERKEYDYYRYNQIYEEDIVDAAKYEGRAEGRAEGREEGRAEGLEEGRLLEKKAMAQKMKEAGVDPALIKELTGMYCTHCIY